MCYIYRRTGHTLMSRGRSSSSQFQTLPRLCLRSSTNRTPVVNSMNLFPIPYVQACQRFNTSPQTPDFLRLIFPLIISIVLYSTTLSQQIHTTVLKIYTWYIVAYPSNCHVAIVL